MIDKQFGPVVMFGLGGVFVELFKDIALPLAPLKEKDAFWLIQQVKGYKLLEGFAEKLLLIKDALIKTILTVSEIVASGHVEEIDLNPVALYQKGAMILDAKMKVSSKEKVAPSFTSHFFVLKILWVGIKCGLINTWLYPL